MKSGVSTDFPRYRTVSKLDTEFESFLDGSFSRHHRALSVSSLNVGSQQEQVTFEIVPRSELVMPPRLAVFSALARPASLVFSVGTALATLALERDVTPNLSVDPLLVSGAIFGVACLHVAVNLFNDYDDHMSGLDRIRPKGGSRAIQKGWVRAVDVRRAAWALFVVAGLSGVPVLLSSPVLVILLGFMFLALEFAFHRLRLKARGWAELIAFLLTGPVLTSSFGWALGVSLSAREPAFGLAFGAIALLYFHSANFENIMVDSQAGAVTWATRVGFYASQMFFHVVSVCILLASLFDIFFVERNVWLLPVFLLQAAWLARLNWRVAKLTSPLASDLLNLRQSAVWLSGLTAEGFILCLFARRLFL